MSRAALGLLLLLVSWTSLGAAPPYNNPVLGDPRKPEPELADPFVLKWCGEYWMYCSGSPILVHHSTDLVHWRTIGPALGPSDKPDAWNQADVWAPEVVYRDGRFYMYYTASRKSEDWRVGEMFRRVGVAVADRPEGPFVDSGRPLMPAWAIDGTVFQDPDDGQSYMFWSYLLEPRTPGAGLVAAPMPAPDVVKPKLSLITRGSEAWEDKDGDPKNGSVRYTNEAPVVTKRHGRYYAMYSGGSWDLPTYGVGFASSERVLQGDVNGPGWTKHPAPILRSTPLVDAPGHNALVKAPNGIDDICVYHARTTPFLDPWNRMVFADRLHWVADRMYLEPPSLGPLSPPDRPAFSAPPGADWEPAAGRLTPRSPRLVSYVFEANVRGAATLSAWWRDERNHVDVAIDSEGASLVLTGVREGRPLPEQRAPIKPRIRRDAFHQLTATRDGARLALALDGVNLLASAVDREPATVAIGQAPGTEYRGIALTAGYDDAFDDADHGWDTAGGAWLCEGGSFRQVAAGSEVALALKGDPTTRYEHTVTLQWQDADTSTSHAGVVAAATPDEAILAGWDRQIWPLQRFHVFKKEKSKIVELSAAPMPRGFAYDAPHTIRVLRDGTAFTFFLDGPEIASLRVSIAPARPGLYTAGVRAHFLDAATKHVEVPQNLLLAGSFESSAWTLSGSARYTENGAHSGLRRLVIPTGRGSATQTIPAVPAGKYTLHAFGIAPAEARATIKVPGASAPLSGVTWTALTVPFELTAPQSDVTITVEAEATRAPVTFDDLYLSRDTDR